MLNLAHIIYYRFAVYHCRARPEAFKLHSEPHFAFGWIFKALKIKPAALRTATLTQWPLVPSIAAAIARRLASSAAITQASVPDIQP